MKKAVELKNICKSYKTEDGILKVLEDISVSFEYGKFYVINGHSGSGKTTLINIIGLLLQSDSGEYIISGKDIKDYKEKDICNLRLHNIGYIFQNYNLSKTLKAYENVMLPMIINDDIKREERYPLAVNLLDKVGLKQRIKHYPKELSGGEQQRVSIARSLANNPNIIIADEPTGNLDVKNETIIFDILKNLSKEGKCIIVVTHSKNAEKHADYIYELKDGKLSKVK